MSFKRLLILVSLLFFPFLISFGQPGGGPPPDPGPAPISGIEWLIGAGVLLGIKKFRDFRKQK